MHSRVTLVAAILAVVGAGSCRCQDLPKTLVNEADGAKMVLIPAGEFSMGDAQRFDSQPVHTVYVDAFHMDAHEVTNKQWRRFVEANPQWQKDRVDVQFHDGNYLKHWDGNSYPPEKADHPVVCVSWYAAAAYARWAGKRLPSEAEWERAAAGTHGYKYAWGNDWRTDKANTYGGVADTRPVGSYEPGEYGLYDMTGNVMEFCADWFSDTYYTASPARNPTGPASGPSHVLRGGAWNYGDTRCTNTYRFHVTPPLGDRACTDFIGLRCVRDARQPEPPAESR